MSIAKEMTRLRKRMLMNRSQFAALLDLHRQTIYTYEKGIAKPSYAVIRKLMKVGKKFNVTENVNIIINQLIKEDD